MLKELLSSLFEYFFSRYNSRAKEWVNGGLDLFKEASFTVGDNVAEADTTATGKFYPIRDSCMKKDDPAEKCLTTEALFYKSYVSYGEIATTLKIKSGEDIVVSKDYPSNKKIYYDPSDLGCTKEMYFSYSFYILVPSAVLSVIARAVIGVPPRRSVLLPAI